MIVWLERRGSNKMIKLDLKVDYTVPAGNLLVVFHDKDMQVSLDEGETTPIDQFRIRKLHHIVKGVAIFEGQKHHLTIGNVLINSIFEPLLLDEKPEGKYLKFENRMDFGGFGFSDFRILNYDEYKYLKENLDETPLTLKDFLSESFKDWCFMTNIFAFVNTTPFDEKSKNFKLYLRRSGFNIFLDEQQLKNKNRDS